MILESEPTFNAVLFLSALISLYFLVFGHRKHVARKSGLRSPFIEDFLRLPGHSARLQRLEHFDQLTERYNQFLLLSAVLIFSYLFLSSLLGVICFVAAIAGVIFVLVKAWKLYGVIQESNLVCDGEEYTGQELNYLWAEGAVVFHDIPYSGGNIDHIVIGNDKVFAVETLTLHKDFSIHPAHQSNSVVRYTGDTLQFPLFETDEPLCRATRHARYLEHQILQNCEVEFHVMPVVAIPGWHVNISSSGRAEKLVINPKRGAGLKSWLGTIKKPEERNLVLSYLSSVARSIPPTSKRTDSTAGQDYEFWLSPRFRGKILND